MSQYIVVLGNSQAKNIGAILASLCDTFDLPKEIFHDCDNFTLQASDKNSLNLLALSPDDFENNKINTASFYFPKDHNKETVTAETSTQETTDTRLLFIPAEQNLAQQIHQLYHWHQRYHFEIQAIISVIDSTFFASNCPNLCDAMAHFADLLFIDNIPANNTPPISSEQLKTYIHHCKKKECYPLSIQTLTTPDVTRIRELNDLRPRRMTLIFDDIDPIDLLDEDKLGQAPFTIPTLDQCDKYLKQDEQGRYTTPIESLSVQFH